MVRVNITTILDLMIVRILTAPDSKWVIMIVSHQTGALVGLTSHLQRKVLCLAISKMPLHLRDLLLIMVGVISQALVKQAVYHLDNNRNKRNRRVWAHPLPSPCTIPLLLRTQMRVLINTTTLWGRERMQEIKVT